MIPVSARRRTLLKGPVLIGFNDLFERSFGHEDTPAPYPKVTPTFLGGAIVPFPCPHCGETRRAVVDPKTRLGYYDRERGFSWCPACQKRYVINARGGSALGELPPDVKVKPALVERDGEVSALLPPKVSGLDMLGAA